MDLHFPASDIPAQARALYHLNSLRLIPDATDTPSPLLAASHAKASLSVDMSHCVLRSVSPVHLEYLANMGVRASMSLSLFRRGRLWGLISCSQSTPRYVPQDIRSAAALVGEFVSALIESKEDTADATYYLDLKAVQSALLQRMLQAKDIVHALTQYTPSVLDATRAQGAAIVLGDKTHLMGRTPSEAQVRTLAHWVSEQPGSKFWHTNSLPTVYPPGLAFKETGCGVIALPLTHAQTTGCSGSGRRLPRPSIGAVIRINLSINLIPDGCGRVNLLNFGKRRCGLRRCRGVRRSCFPRKSSSTR